MDSQIVLIVIVGAVALVKWLIENAGKSAGSAGEDTLDDPVERPAPRRPIQPPANAAGSSPRGETDEEKMRRFMEALGLPSNGVPPPQRPVQQRRPAAPAIPRNVAPQAPRPPVRPGQRPPAQRPAVPAPQPSQPAPAARRSIAAPLDTGGPIPDLPKSRPMSESAPAVEVTSFRPAAPAPAPAGEGKEARRTAALASSASSASAASAPDLREQLRDPASLRRAILMREILGEPKGLQSLERPSIFSPL